MLLPRITSYNVCYTKLLRLESINQNIPNIWSKYFGIVGSGFDTKSFVLVRQANVYEKVLGRITSYNVCYTKLLRDMSSVAIGILSRIQSKQSISRIETTRSYSPSLKDLMPVFDFVKYEGQIVPWETMTDRNRNNFV